MGAIAATALTGGMDAIGGLVGLQTTAGNGSINLITGGTMTVNEAIAANGNGVITLQSYGGGIALGADVTTTGNAMFVAGAAISRTAGLVSADQLTLNAQTSIGASAGPGRVHTSVNRLEALAKNGGICLTEANGLEVGGITNSLTLGLRSMGANADIEVLVEAGALTITDGIRTDPNNTVRLRAAGNITQTGGIVTMDLGAVSDTGTVNLSAATNGVKRFAGQANVAGQSVYYQDVDDLIVHEISAGGTFASTVSGVSAGHDVELLAPGSLSIERAIAAGLNASDTVRLKTNWDAVTQTATGAITAHDFSVQAGTIINLSAAANDVDVFRRSRSRPRAVQRPRWQHNRHGSGRRVDHEQRHRGDAVVPECMSLHITNVLFLCVPRRFLEAPNHKSQIANKFPIQKRSKHPGINDWTKVV